MKRILATVISLVMAFDAALAAPAQSNIWSERRARAQHNAPLLAALPPALAALPAASALLPQAALDRRPAPNPMPAAAPASPALARLLNAIPLTAATIHAVHAAPGSGSPVVVVEDVHLNVDAQRNIAQVLEKLGDAGVGAVGVEGAFDPFPVARVRSLPNREATAEAALALLKSNVISAPSYVAATAATPPDFVGIDDARLHRENVAAYLSTRQSLASDEASIERLSAAAEALKGRVFNPALRRWDGTETGYNTGSVSFADRARALADLAAGAGVAVPPMVSLFLETLNLEAALDLKQVESERRAFLEALAPKMSDAEMESLASASVAYRLGQLSVADFYGALSERAQKKGVSLARWPAFGRYLRYVLAADRIDGDALFRDIDGLDRTVAARLTRSPQEAALVGVVRDLGLLRRLVRFEIAPAEWQGLRARRPTVAGLSTTLSRLGAGALAETFSLQPYEQFYEAADARSAAMTARLLSLPVPSAAARAIVVGGFHTPEVTELLDRQKISYVVVTPKITRVDEASGSGYLSVFAQRATPLDRIFSGERLFVSPTTIHLTNAPTERYLTAAAAAKDLLRPDGPPRVAGERVEAERESDGSVDVRLAEPNGTLTLVARPGRTDGLAGSDALGLSFQRAARPAALIPFIGNALYAVFGPKRWVPVLGAIIEQLGMWGVYRLLASYAGLSPIGVAVSVAVLASLFTALHPSVFQGSATTPRSATIGDRALLFVLGVVFQLPFALAGANPETSFVRAFAISAALHAAYNALAAGRGWTVAMSAVSSFGSLLTSPANSPFFHPIEAATSERPDLSDAAPNVAELRNGIRIGFIRGQLEKANRDGDTSFQHAFVEQFDEVTEAVLNADPTGETYFRDWWPLYADNKSVFRHFSGLDRVVRAMAASKADRTVLRQWLKTFYSEAIADGPSFRVPAAESLASYFEFLMSIDPSGATLKNEGLPILEALTNDDGTPYPASAPGLLVFAGFLDRMPLSEDDYRVRIAPLYGAAARIDVRSDHARIEQALPAVTAAIRAHVTNPTEAAALIAGIQAGVHRLTPEPLSPERRGALLRAAMRFLPASRFQRLERWAARRTANRWAATALSPQDFSWRDRGESKRAVSTFVRAALLADPSGETTFPGPDGRPTTLWSGISALIEGGTTDGRATAMELLRVAGTELLRRGASDDVFINEWFPRIRALIPPHDSALADIDASYELWSWHEELSLDLVSTLDAVFRRSLAVRPFTGAILADLQNARDASRDYAELVSSEATFPGRVRFGSSSRESDARINAIVRSLATMKGALPSAAVAPHQLYRQAQGLRRSAVSGDVALQLATTLLAEGYPLTVPSPTTTWVAVMDLLARAGADVAGLDSAAAFSEMARQAIRRGGPLMDLEAVSAAYQSYFAAFGIREAVPPAAQPKDLIAYVLLDFESRRAGLRTRPNGAALPFSVVLRRESPAPYSAVLPIVDVLATGTIVPPRPPRAPILRGVRAIAREAQKSAAEPPPAAPRNPFAEAVERFDRQAATETDARAYWVQARRLLEIAAREWNAYEKLGVMGRVEGLLASPEVSSQSLYRRVRDNLRGLASEMAAGPLRTRLVQALITLPADPDAERLAEIEAILDAATPDDLVQSIVSNVIGLTKDATLRGEPEAESLIALGDDLAARVKIVADKRELSRFVIEHLDALRDVLSTAAPHVPPAKAKLFSNIQNRISTLDDRLKLSIPPAAHESYDESRAVLADLQRLLKGRPEFLSVQAERLERVVSDLVVDVFGLPPIASRWKSPTLMETNVVRYFAQSDRSGAYGRKHPLNAAVGAYFETLLMGGDRAAAIEAYQNKARTVINGRLPADFREALDPFLTERKASLQAPAALTMELAVGERRREENLLLQEWNSALTHVAELLADPTFAATEAGEALKLAQVELLKAPVPTEEALRDLRVWLTNHPMPGDSDVAQTRAVIADHMKQVEQLWKKVGGIIAGRARAADERREQFTISREEDPISILHLGWPRLGGSCLDLLDGINKAWAAGYLVPYVAVLYIRRAGDGARSARVSIVFDPVRRLLFATGDPYNSTEVEFQPILGRYLREWADLLTRAAAERGVPGPVRAFVPDMLRIKYGKALPTPNELGDGFETVTQSLSMPFGVIGYYSDLTGHTHNLPNGWSMDDVPGWLYAPSATEASGAAPTTADLLATTSILSNWRNGAVWRRAFYYAGVGLWEEGAFRFAVAFVGVAGLGTLGYSPRQSLAIALIVGNVVFLLLHPIVRYATRDRAQAWSWRYEILSEFGGGFRQGVWVGDLRTFLGSRFVASALFTSTFAAPVLFGFSPLIGFVLAAAVHGTWDAVAASTLGVMKTTTPVHEPALDEGRPSGDAAAHDLAVMRPPLIRGGAELQVQVDGLGRPQEPLRGREKFPLRLVSLSEDPAVKARFRERFAAFSELIDSNFAALEVLTRHSSGMSRDSAEFILDRLDRMIASLERLAAGNENVFVAQVGRRIGLRNLSDIRNQYNAIRSDIEGRLSSLRSDDTISDPAVLKRIIDLHPSERLANVNEVHTMINFVHQLSYEALFGIFDQMEPGEQENRDDILTMNLGEEPLVRGDLVQNRALRAVLSSWRGHSNTKLIVRNHEVWIHTQLGEHAAEIYLNLASPDSGGEIRLRFVAGYQYGQYERMLMIANALTALGIAVRVEGDQFLIASLNKDTGAFDANQLADLVKKIVSLSQQVFGRDEDLAIISHSALNGLMAVQHQFGVMTVLRLLHHPWFLEQFTYFANWARSLPWGTDPDHVRQSLVRFLTTSAERDPWLTFLLSDSMVDGFIKTMGVGRGFQSYVGDSDDALASEMERLLSRTKKDTPLLDHPPATPLIGAFDALLRQTRDKGGAKNDAAARAAARAFLASNAPTGLDQTARRQLADYVEMQNNYRSSAASVGHYRERIDQMAENFVADGDLDKQEQGAWRLTMPNTFRVYADVERFLRRRFNRTLARVGLAVIPRTLPFGQYTVDNYVNTAIVHGLATGSLRRRWGRLQRNPNYQPVDAVAGSVERDTARAVSLGRLFNLLEDHVPVRAVGSAGRLKAFEGAWPLASGNVLVFRVLRDPTSGRVVFADAQVVSLNGGVRPVNADEVRRLVVSEGIVVPDDPGPWSPLLTAKALDLLHDRPTAVAPYPGAVSEGLSTSRGRRGPVLGPVTFDPEFYRRESLSHFVFMAPFTTPDDLPAIRSAHAVVTTTGGMYSHAGVTTQEYGIASVTVRDAVWLTENGVRFLRLRVAVPLRARRSNGIWVSEDVATQTIDVHEGDYVLVDGETGMISVIPFTDNVALQEMLQAMSRADYFTALNLFEDMDGNSLSTPEARRAAALAASTLLFFLLNRADIEDVARVRLVRQFAAALAKMPIALQTEAKGYAARVLRSFAEGATTALVEPERLMATGQWSPDVDAELGDWDERLVRGELAGGMLGLPVDELQAVGTRYQAAIETAAHERRTAVRRILQVLDDIDLRTGAEASWDLTALKAAAVRARQLGLTSADLHGRLDDIDARIKALSERNVQRLRASGRHVAAIDSLREEDAALTGGKAAKQGEIREVVEANGGRVLSGVSFFTTAFFEAIREAGLAEQYMDLARRIDRVAFSPRPLSERQTAVEPLARAMRELIGRAALHADRGVGAELTAELHRQELDRTLVAVRSTGIQEDMDDAAFAGAAETELWVEPDDVLNSVMRVAASFYLPRGILYRADRKIRHAGQSFGDETGFQPAVAVQPMFDGDVAGTMVTTDPIRRRPDVMIYASYGAGEGVVSGLVEGDLLTADKGTGQLAEFPLRGSKRVKIVRDPETKRGTQVLVDETLRRRISLNADEVHRLTRIGVALEDHFGYPVEIEFAIKGEDIVILQVRPYAAAKLDRRAGGSMEFTRLNLQRPQPPSDSGGGRTPLASVFNRALIDAGFNVRHPILYALYTTIGVNIEAVFQIPIPAVNAWAAGVGLDGAPVLLLSALVFAAAHDWRFVAGALLRSLGSPAAARFPSRSELSREEFTWLLLQGTVLGLPFLLLPAEWSLLASMATHSLMDAGLLAFGRRPAPAAARPAATSAALATAPSLDRRATLDALIGDLVTVSRELSKGRPSVDAIAEALGAPVDGGAREIGEAPGAGSARGLDIANLTPDEMDYVLAGLAERLKGVPAIAVSAGEVHATVLELAIRGRETEAAHLIAGTNVAVLPTNDDDLRSAAELFSTLGDGFKMWFLVTDSARAATEKRLRALGLGRALDAGRVVLRPARGGFTAGTPAAYGNLDAALDAILESLGARTAAEKAAFGQLVIAVSERAAPAFADLPAGSLAARLRMAVLRRVLSTLMATDLRGDDLRNIGRVARLIASHA